MWETIAGHFRPLRHTLHTGKTKGTHAVRVVLFHPLMDTKGVDFSESKERVIYAFLRETNPSTVRDSLCSYSL
ncbi:hypothetical protein [Aneurinibacillus aneurinilyticus]|uniref:hypothetical protein n=1 Tax=Aneurinibacillus aneurinilyticus TaxID=1391 RepID=UPI0035237EB6